MRYDRSSNFLPLKLFLVIQFSFKERFSHVHSNLRKGNFNRFILKECLVEENKSVLGNFNNIWTNLKLKNIKH